MKIGYIATVKPRKTYRHRKGSKDRHRKGSKDGETTGRGQQQLKTQNQKREDAVNLCLVSRSTYGKNQVTWDGAEEPAINTTCNKCPRGFIVKNKNIILVQFTGLAEKLEYEPDDLNVSSNKPLSVA